ncbi:phage tail tape measure protein [Halocella sp. SP3-1]|uniref:phage tail tape measure protein n=1 Tax=Halocella sp. SP3-1 TaxID=2382161 RepID=UPI0013E032B5|nr:phage tail tape measure protein [Halocella sp. SP3-1]
MKQTESRLDKFSKKAEQVGKKMTKYLTVPIATLATTVSKFGMDFEDSMNQSLAIMDNVSDKMRKRMENTARQVALTVDKSAKEAAESYFYLASAGLDAEQSIAALPEVAQFATAGQFDMAKATDLLTDAQSALGLSVEDASQNMNNLVKVSDVLVKANTLANASVEQFSEALTTKAGAALKTANKSLEEGVAVLAAFADQGIKGQAAGEQFSIAMRYLQEAAINNKEALQEYNVEIFDSTGKMRNMADIVGSLENALDGMSDEQKAAALQAMGFSARVQNVIKVLLGLSDEIRNYEEELNNAGGITDKVAKKQMESMLKQLGLLKDGAIDAALSLYDFAKPTIGEVVIPAVQTLVEKLRDISDWFGKLDPNIQKVIGSLLLLSATIGPLTWTFGKLSGLVGLLAETNVAFAFRAWAGGAATASEAIGFLANAFKPFLIGGTVIVGIKLLYDYLTKIRNEVFGLGKDVNTMNLQQVDDNIAKVEKRLNDLRELFAKRNINPEDYEEGSMAYLNLPSRMRGFIDQYNQMTKRQKELKAQREQLIKQQELLNRLESGGDGDSGGGGGLGSPTQNLSDYQKAINDFEHTMAMGGMSLEDQLSTLSDLYNILTDKQDALNKGIEIDMTEKELASAMTELEERMYSITEEIHKKAIDTAVDDMADSFSRGETNIEDYISFLEKKLEDVQKNENLSYDTREQYAQQFNDRIMQLEYQRETGIQSLNKKFADKQYKLDADKLDNKKRTLNQERDDIKEQYKELLGNTKEYEEKAKEIDDLYRRLRLQAEKEYLAEIEAENDRIMDYKYQSNEISLKEYKSYLEERLIQFKKYSTEWISIKNKLDNLESGA